MLFCLPVAVHGFRHWCPADEHDRYALTPGLLAALRNRGAEALRRLLRPRDQLPDLAFAPVYVAAAPPAHVADTPSNDPYRRRLASIASSHGRPYDPRPLPRGLARVDKRRFQIRPPWQLVYEDQVYALYHRPG